MPIFKTPVKVLERNYSYSLRDKYNLTLNDYYDLLHNQNDGCAICGSKEPGGKDKHFHVDHNHKTGKIRGLLCHRCNLVLGYIEDSFLLADKLMNYLIQKEF